MSRSFFSRSGRSSVPPSFNTSDPSTEDHGGISSTLPLQGLPARVATNSSLSLRGIERLERRRSMEEQQFLQKRTKKRNLNPPPDLRLLDYASPYDSNLMCPICRCPFVDPVVLIECDHCFCRECIRQCWTSHSNYTPLGPRGDCPTCRTPAKLGPRSATSKILTNIVDELVVKCPKAADGCRVEVKRGEVHDHINIYCGYALIECVADNCEESVWRKDISKGCLHFPVSCMACHLEMQIWQLEVHWESKCPDRRVVCHICQNTVFYRELEVHSKKRCPAVTVPCAGEALGCSSRGKRKHMDFHGTTCAFAKLAPILEQQKKRLDEQEVAQKQMSRKLEVLETGFNAFRSILYPSATPDQEGYENGAGLQQYATMPTLLTPSSLELTNYDDQPASGSLPYARRTDATRPFDEETGFLESSQHRHEPFANAETSENISTDVNHVALPPPSVNGGPYASPLHHLLSMHESLRDEMGRISSALSELDGRQSMQSLNENLRTREEISYLGAQVAGLQRQVHWLTSAQLQRQHRVTPSRPGASADSGVDDVVEVVNSAATALRGAAGMVGIGSAESSRDGGSGIRRRASEEGRTKL